MRKDKSNTLSQEVLDQMVLDFVQKSDVGFQMAQLFNLLDTDFREAPNRHFVTAKFGQ